MYRSTPSSAATHREAILSSTPWPCRWQREPHVVDLHRDDQGCCPRFNALSPLA